MRFGKISCVIAGRLCSLRCVLEANTLSEEYGRSSGAEKRKGLRGLYIEELQLAQLLWMHCITIVKTIVVSLQSLLCRSVWTPL